MKSISLTIGQCSLQIERTADHLYVLRESKAAAADTAEALGELFRGFDLPEPPASADTPLPWWNVQQRITRAIMQELDRSPEPAPKTPGDGLCLKCGCELEEVWDSATQCYCFPECCAPGCCQRGAERT